MAGMNSADDPSMSRPMRPSTYAGALTAAPSAPLTAVAASLSRRGRVHGRQAEQQSHHGARAEHDREMAAGVGEPRDEIPDAGQQRDAERPFA